MSSTVSQVSAATTEDGSQVRGGRRKQTAVRLHQKPTVSEAANDKKLAELKTKLESLLTENCKLRALFRSSSNTGLLETLKRKVKRIDTVEKLMRQYSFPAVTQEEKSRVRRFMEFGAQEEANPLTKITKQITNCQESITRLRGLIQGHLNSGISFGAKNTWGNVKTRVANFCTDPRVVIVGILALIVLAPLAGSCH